MTFWEALALVGTATTILGVFLTVYGMVNNRVTKAGFRQMHLEMQEGFRILAVLVTEKSEEKRAELLNRLFGPTT